MQANYSKYHPDNTNRTADITLPEKVVGPPPAVTLPESAFGHSQACERPYGPVESNTRMTKSSITPKVSTLARYTTRPAALEGLKVVKHAETHADPQNAHHSYSSSFHLFSLRLLFSRLLSVTYLPPLPLTYLPTYLPLTSASFHSNHMRPRRPNSPLPAPIDPKGNHWPQVTPSEPQRLHCAPGRPDCDRQLHGAGTLQSDFRHVLRIMERHLVPRKSRHAREKLTKCLLLFHTIEGLSAARISRSLSMRAGELMLSVGTDSNLHLDNADGHLVLLALECYQNHNTLPNVHTERRSA
eukprot:3529870-Pleurochrysis_carterae.AAC.2